MAEVLNGADGSAQCFAASAAKSQLGQLSLMGHREQDSTRPDVQHAM